MTKFIYCFLRKDIEPVQQIIQLGHVAFEAGKSFGRDFDIPHMCLFEVNDLQELMKTAKYIKSKNIKYEIFFEPDNRMKFTSICTEIVDDSLGKEIFSEYKLFNANSI